MDELGIGRHRGKVLLVPETVATKDLVKLESIKDSSVFSGHASVARAHHGKVSWITVEAAEQGWRKGACFGGQEFLL